MLQFIFLTVSAIGRFLPNRSDIERFAKRLFCSPEDLSDELRVRPALFGEKGEKHELRQHAITEWLEEDPRASTLKFVIHLINLDEIDTIEHWVRCDYAASLTEIDAYHLKLLSDRNPSPEVIFATARALTCMNGEDITHLIPIDISNQSPAFILHQVIGLLIQLQMSTEELINFLRSHSFFRPAEVLKIHALVELNLCALPNDMNTPPDDHALQFIANHMTCTAQNLSGHLHVNDCSASHFTVLRAWRERDHATFRDFIFVLKDLQQHYAIAMILIMTGSPQRQRIIFHRHLKFLESQCSPSERFMSSATNFCNQRSHLLCHVVPNWNRSTAELISLLRKNFGEEINDILKQAFGECILV